MRPTTRVRLPVFARAMQVRFAVLLMSVLIWAFVGAACGVQEGQEKVEKARQVEKQLDERQQNLEKRLQEGGQKVEEGQ